MILLVRDSGLVGGCGCGYRGGMNFKVVVHPEASGGYWGEIPALAGCYSQGETVAELVENLREAAIGYLEVLRAEGRTPDPEVQILELAV